MSPRGRRLRAERRTRARVRRCMMRAHREAARVRAPMDVGYLWPEARKGGRYVVVWYSVAYPPAHPDHFDPSLHFSGQGVRRYERALSLGFSEVATVGVRR